MKAFFVLAATLATALAAPKTLPSNWPTCNRKDPKLGECIQKAVHVAVADLSSKGAKEFGVFPIDPLKIEHLNIAQGSGPVSIELKFSDLEIYGLRNAKLDVLKADVENYHFQAPLTIPEGVTLKGQYKVNGKVLVLPINGEGPCELKLDNITAMVDLIGKEKKKDGVNYLEVQEFKFNFEPTRLQIRLENLFNGNKQLSDQMNVFLNENWPEILNELKPAIQEAFGAAFGDISNRIFKRVPYNKVFP